MERLRGSLRSRPVILRPSAHYWVTTAMCRAWCFHCGTVYLWDGGVRRYIPLRPLHAARLADGSPLISEELEEPLCMPDPKAWRLERIES